MKMLTSCSLLIFPFVVACSAASDRPSKDDGAALAKTDQAVDWCDVLAFYGDGECDTFCHSPDPDCETAAACDVAPQATDLLVALEDGGAVLLDPASGVVRVAAATGPNAFGALFTRDGRRAFVTDKNEGTLVEIDPASGTILHKLPVGATPQQPAMTSTGLLYIPLSGESAIAVVDIAQSPAQLLRKVPTGEGTKPHIVALSPDDRTLWATVQGKDPKVVSFALEAGAEGPMKEYRYDMVPRVVSASNKGAWFTGHHSTGMHRVDLATGAVSTPYMDVYGPASEARKQIEGVDTTAGDELMALTHEGRKALVAFSLTASGKAETIVDISPLSAAPYWVTIDPGQEVLYVSIPGSGTVEAYSLEGCQLWSATTGGRPKRMSAVQAQ